MAGIIGRKFSATKRWHQIGPFMQCWFVIEHSDLHATKGWRKARRFSHHVKETSKEWIEAPLYREWFKWRDGVGEVSERLEKGPSDRGRLMRRRIPNPGPVALSPHDWFRRKVFGSSKRISSMTGAERTRFNKAMEEFRHAQANMR